MNQDICMETVHGRKNKNKTTFKAVLNKVLVSAVVLGTVAGMGTPAFAADLSSPLGREAQTVAYSQGISVQDAISNIRNTLNSINEMKANGTVSDSKLSELAVQLGNLERAATGKEVSNELIQLVQDTEKAISGYSTSGAIKAQGALAMLKLNLNIPDTITVENKEAGPITFDDVPTSHWAYTDIMTIAGKGAINGTTTPVNGVGHFDPTGTVSLGQFLTIATRLVASDKIAPQVEGEHWAMANYRAAIEAGLITRNDFLPSSLDTSITRQDMAFILVNVAKVNGETLTITPNIENNISDYDTISQHRANAVKQAYSNGLLQGNGGNFNPNGTAKRAEISAVFCRVMNYVARPEVTIKENPSDKLIMGGYVSNDGDTKGMLISKYSRQYDLEALSQIRMGSDSKGVYVTFTAPVLPDEIKNEFTFKFYSNVYKDNGDLFVKSIEVLLKSGESKTVYFSDFHGSAIASSQIGSAKVDVAIQNSNNRYMMGHFAESTNKKTAIEEWFNGTADTLSFDSTAIFAGIGK